MFELRVAVELPPVEFKVEIAELDVDA